MHSGIFWNILHAYCMYSGIFRNILHASRNILEHSRTFYNILEHSGTFWNNLEHSGTFWNILEHSGTFWNILEHSSCILEHSSTFCMHSGQGMHTDRIHLHYILFPVLYSFVLSCTVLYCLVLSGTDSVCVHSLDWVIGTHTDRQTLGLVGLRLRSQKVALHLYLAHSCVCVCVCVLFQLYQTITRISWSQW